jgi:hypothetical protein
MRFLCLAFLGLCLVTSGFGQDKKAEAVLHKVDALALSQEFEKDFAAALKKYDPKPPKGGAGGAVIETGGPVKDISGKNVTLDLGKTIPVTLVAKKFTGFNPREKKLFAEGLGTLNVGKTNKKRIVIDCDEVTLGKIEGESKKK